MPSTLSGCVRFHSSPQLPCSSPAIMSCVPIAPSPSRGRCLIGSRNRDVNVRATDRAAECGLAAAILPIDLGPRIEKGAADIEQPAGGGVVQRATAGAVRNVGVRAARQQVRCENQNAASLRGIGLLLV